MGCSCGCLACALNFFEPFSNEWTHKPRIKSLDEMLEVLLIHLSEDLLDCQWVVEMMGMFRGSTGAANGDTAAILGGKRSAEGAESTLTLCFCEWMGASASSWDLPPLWFSECA